MRRFELNILLTEPLCQAKLAAKKQGHSSRNCRYDRRAIGWMLVLMAPLASAPAASAGPAFETKEICRTGIAVVMDRDPKTLQATDAPENVVVLTYARPFDNFVFTYRCRIEGDRVVWADEPGRWRDGAKDAKISYEITATGDRIRITVSRAGGASLQQLFDRELNEVH